MALMPRRVKHRKVQRGRIRGQASRGAHVVFGEYGLKSLEPAWLSARQIEAGRIAATHFLAHEGRIFIRVFPHKPISSKPADTRMGKGKGEPDFYAAVVKPGQVLFEIGGVPEELARQALARVAYKMPVRTKFVARRLKV